MKKIAAILLATAVTMGSLSTTASASVFVNGYTKSNGTYVGSHYRSSPDGFTFNNYSNWR